MRLSIGTEVEGSGRGPFCRTLSALNRTNRGQQKISRGNIAGLKTDNLTQYLQIIKPIKPTHLILNIII
jgi:hypothetical protein